MELGFNFKNKKVEVMESYQVLNFFFDYENDFYNQPLNIGADKLEEFFLKVKSFIEVDKNYSLKIKINNENYLDFDEYFTLFSTFSYILTNNSGLDNKKGYLSVDQELRNQLVCTDYILLKIKNNDYEYGIIQLTIEDSFDTEVKWASKNS